MTLKIITWNINSIRKRYKHVCKILKENNPDVICLQETKVIDELFPYSHFKDIGYNYILTSGQKSYNGVAIISKIPIKKLNTLDWFGSKERRHISVILPKNIELHNCYFPAGGLEPDINNDKFAYKLKSFKKAAYWSKSQKKGKKRILLGDLNIAPSENDVWSHDKLIKVVSHTPIEVEHYNELFNSSDWCDAIRFNLGYKKKLYSWWSYRNINWKKENKGRRLDHIWVTKNLEKKILDIKIIKKTRGWKEPSDHIPILIDLDY